MYQEPGFKQCLSYLVCVAVCAERFEGFEGPNPNPYKSVIWLMQTGNTLLSTSLRLFIEIWKSFMVTWVDDVILSLHHCHCYSACCLIHSTVRPPTSCPVSFQQHIPEIYVPYNLTWNWIYEQSWLVVEFLLVIN